MPRAGLSRALVARAAADLADEIGYERLTLAALADRLGVAVPSLYKHVEGLPALRREVAILGLRELGAALAGAPAGTKAAPAGDRGWLSVLARAYRRFAVEHPGRYAATVRAAAPGDAEHASASDDVLAVVLGLLAERGLERAAAIDATRALRAGLHGFVSLEAAGGFGLPQDVDRSFERLVEILAAGIDRPVDPVAVETSS